MAETNNTPVTTTAPEPKKKKKGCFGSCCITLLIIAAVIFVLLAAGCTVGLIYADKMLKQQFDVGVGDCWSVLVGISKAKEKNLVSDPVASNDEDDMYAEIKKALFLGENADLKSIVDDLIANADGDADKESEGSKNAVYATEGDGTGDGSNESMQEFYDRIIELYSDGNLDANRLRGYIENNTDISAVYDTDFIVNLKGNGFAAMIERVMRNQLEKDEGSRVYADKIHIREIRFCKSGENARIRIVVKIDMKSMLSSILSQESANIPPIAHTMMNMMIPKATFGVAELTLSSPAKLDVRVNSMTGANMQTVYKIVYKASDGKTDIRAELDKAAEEVAKTIRENVPSFLTVLENVDANGKIKLDPYGMIADALNKDKPEDKKVTGVEMVSLVIGAVGSEEKSAIEDRIALDSRFGEVDWQSKYAFDLVENMADSFSLAKSYFVNGTDENGNKILSVDGGTIVGSDKILGRVYSGADGTLYYKRSGGKFKIYLSGNRVSDYYVDGYAEYLSLGLHYKSGGDDYTLYKSGDGKTIYGVSGSKIQPRNGEYTELTTLYVDTDGNVYSSPNAKPNLIEISKEKLSVDVIRNALSGENVDYTKLLDLIDFSALRVNGVSGWLDPVEINGAQFAAMLGELLPQYLGADMKKADPHVAYAKISLGSNSTALVTLGMTIDVSALVSDDTKQFVKTFLGDRIYAEVTCDVTLGKNENEYAATIIRYNNLTDEQTAGLLSTLGKISSEFDLTGTLENAAREIRKTLKSLDDSIGIDFIDGAIRTGSIAKIISTALGGEEIADQTFVSSIDMFLGSDSAAGIALEKSKNPDFASENWAQNGVNTFVVNFSEAFILDKNRFAAADGVNYSLEKIMQIADGGSFAVDDIQPYLNYEVMKNDGFSQWKNAFSASDVEVAAMFDYFVGDDASLKFKPAIESLHVFKENGKEKLRVALSVDTKSLFGDNDALSRIIAVMDEKVLLTLTVDVTTGAANRDETLIELNDLSADKTSELISTLSKIMPEFNVGDLLSEAENTLISSLEKVRNSLKFEFEQGKITFDAPANLIYSALVTTPDADFTANDMADALTALTTSGNRYYKENNGFVADTSRDEQSRAFWNDTLKTKYFLSTDISTLFDALIGGGNVYGVVSNGLDKNLFVKTDGTFAHSSIEDAAYSADSEKFSWLLRSNSASLIGLTGSDAFEGMEVYGAAIEKQGDKAKVTVTISVPTADVIANAGSLDQTVKTVILSVLPEKTAFEISWAQGESAQVSYMGMNAGQIALVETLLVKVGGEKLSGEGSRVDLAAQTVRSYFDDNFEFGLSGDEGCVSMPDFYELVAKNVFSPDKPDKDHVSKEDVYALIKTLYERPEKNGAFDSTVVGYVSKNEDVEKLSEYVNDDSYSLVGATETLVLSLDAPQAKLKATVLYTLSISGDAAKVLPENVYITLDYDAHPVINGFNINIDGSEISAIINKGENNDAVNRCFNYLGVDVDAAVNLAKTQLDSYINDNVRKLFGM